MTKERRFRELVSMLTRRMRELRESGNFAEAGKLERARNEALRVGPSYCRRVR